MWSGAVMYLRTTTRANKEGSIVRYLALAHNQRVGAATKANVLLNLGREDRLDPDRPRWPAFDQPLPRRTRHRHRCPGSDRHRPTGLPRGYG